ncbi:MAG: hypothetical protein KDK24_11985 [Pseudooceanicola sp.]|nr:hypothetical protein [Pseudooceanicola sp.]
MRKSLILLVLASLVLASCGFRDSRINPRNWFGGSRSVAASAETAETNPLIPRRSGLLGKRPAPPQEKIATVTELKIEPTNTGAIVYASGVAVRQGAYLARLTPRGGQPVPDENGVLTFDFMVTYPVRPTAGGSELTRTVHEAYSLSKQDLAAIRTIRVEGAQNAQETRRRR